MVTGAGGSMAQIISSNYKIKTKKINSRINEFALYKISEDLKNINKSIKIIPLLINIQNN